MLLESFIKMYGGIVSPIIKEQIDYAIAVEKILNERVEKYKHDKLANLSISPETTEGQNKTINWDDICGVDDQMKILSIQNETMIQAFIALGEKYKINPLTLFVPPVFFDGMHNNLEKLHIYGDAYDKILLMNWRFFKQHFVHMRKFMFSTNEYMKILLDAVSAEKLISLCKRCNDFIQNYDLTENLLKYKDTGLLYGSQIQFDMTVLTEFITQCLDRQDMELIRATMTVIHQQLVQYPQIIYTIVMQSLYYLTAILDIECCDFTKDVRITLEIPRAIISDRCDPMKSADFRHQEDKTIMQDKINQYNTLVNNLPAWDIIEGLTSKLKYTKLQINQQERQKQFEEVNKIIDECEKNKGGEK